MVDSPEIRVLKDQTKVLEKIVKAIDDNTRELKKANRDFYVTNVFSGGDSESIAPLDSEPPVVHLIKPIQFQPEIKIATQCDSDRAIGTGILGTRDLILVTCDECNARL